MVKKEERSGGGEVNVIAPTVHSNSKSNMAFWINDRELITLARPNKTPHYRLGVSPCNKYIHARERFLIFTWSQQNYSFEDSKVQVLRM